MPYKLIADHAYTPSEEFGRLQQPFVTVSIFGPYSSGKSTLLNDLFKTEFDTLKLTTPKMQTTKGVVFDICDNFLVLDVEGADSAERQFQGYQVNEKIAAFACAVGDIFIVNMWEHDVGRWYASGYAILEKVFGVYAEKLKGQRSAIKLVVCVRDAKDNGEEQRALQIQQISADIEQIWRRQNADCAIAECFRLEFSFMPHREYEATKYTLAVKQLKESLRSSAAAWEVPRELANLHFGKLWSTISSDEDLDLEQERCMIYALKYGSDLYRVLDEFGQACAELDCGFEVQEFSLSTTQNFDRCRRGCRYGQFIDWARDSKMELLQERYDDAITKARECGSRVAESTKDQMYGEFLQKLSKLHCGRQKEHVALAKGHAVQCFKDFHEKFVEQLYFLYDNQLFSLETTALGTMNEVVFSYRSLQEHSAQQSEALPASIFLLYAAVLSMTASLFGPDSWLFKGSEGDEIDIIDRLEETRLKFAREAVQLYYKQQEARFVERLKDGVIVLIYSFSAGLYSELERLRNDYIAECAAEIQTNLRYNGVVFGSADEFGQFFIPKIYPAKHLAQLFNSIIYTIVQTSAEVYLLQAVKRALPGLQIDDAFARIDALQAGRLQEAAVDGFAVSYVQLQISYPVIYYCTDFLRQQQQGAVVPQSGGVPLLVWLLLAFFGRNDIKYVLYHKVLLCLTIMLVGVVLVYNQRGKSVKDHALRAAGGLRYFATALAGGEYNKALDGLKSAQKALAEYFS